MFCLTGWKTIYANTKLLTFHVLKCKRTRNHIKKPDPPALKQLGCQSSRSLLSLSFSHKCTSYCVNRSTRNNLALVLQLEVFQHLPLIKFIKNIFVLTCQALNTSEKHSGEPHLCLTSFTNIKPPSSLPRALNCYTFRCVCILVQYERGTE